MTARTDAATLAALARQVRAARGVAHKRDIAAVVDRLGLGGAFLGEEAGGPGGSGPDGGPSGPGGGRLDSCRPDSAIAPAVPLGDDCAAWADGDGFLLLAIEGFVNAFVAAEPRFAGYCGVMVNVSDIYAMGGRPIAVVDALWSRPGEAATPILDGLAQAARVYGVPIVGGHSNRQCDREQLAVAILGRATRLLSSFAARAGEHLVAAIDLRGGFHEPFPYWDASSGAPAARLRADLDILPQLAESGLCRAAKDISMAGIVGTALMFAECSACGLAIDVDAIPRPPTVPLARWLDIFPSYGFLLAVDDAALPAVLAAFAQRGLAAAAIGRFDASRVVRLRAGDANGAIAADANADADADQATVWDFTQEALIGCGPCEVGR
ncbi:MAG: sll0787 family AIR synthase-like protein [Janthinobacterium lividum]